MITIQIDEYSVSPKFLRDTAAYLTAIATEEKDARQVEIVFGDGSPSKPKPFEIADKDNERTPAEVIEKAKADTAEAVAAPEAPVVPAPPAPVTAPAAPVAEAPAKNEDTDIHGLTWDKRIHASSKAKLQDGSWRLKRGVEQSLVDQVEAEQKNGRAAEVADTQGVEAPLASGRSFSEVVTLMTGKIQSDPSIGDRIQKALADAGYKPVPQLVTESPEVLSGVYDLVQEVM